MLVVDQLQIRAGASDGPVLLDGVSLSLDAGEAVGLVGPSGCGKTTLLRAIAGLIDPAGGRVTLGGQTPEQIGWPVFRRRVGLVPQRPVVWDGSVWKNLRRPGGFKSVGEACDKDAAHAMLQAVGLHDKLHAEARTLSEGERQRVCLVRALLAAPRFVLLDEPTSALDEDAATWVDALLIGAMEAKIGSGVLIVTHDRAFAERFCARVIDLAAHMPGAKAVADA